MTKSPSRVFAALGRALTDGFTNPAPPQPARPVTDMFAATRHRNDTSPNRHTNTHRHYETNRTDFRYLIEDIWDGYPVDESATDSIVTALRLILGAADQGYASRITAQDGTLAEIAREGEGGYLDDEWGAPDARSLVMIGRNDV